jgi:uncharacterized repeat protein (TIGR04138 family)
MPGESELAKSLRDVVDELGLYPPQAFDFVQRGLVYTVDRIHENALPGACRHVTGEELCLGLLEYAQLQWGLMAGAVLRRWNIFATIDFGRIVFAMVDNGYMAKTEQDSIDDFRNVYDFRSAFDAGYKIASLP